MPLGDLAAVGTNPKLTPFQRGFIADILDLLQAEALPQLDPSRVTGAIRGKRHLSVQITLPHRADPKMTVEVFIEPDTVVFSYGVDHRHFGYGAPEPPVDDALDFARDLLLGRIEVEVDRHLGFSHVRTYRVADDGTREKLQDSHNLGPLSKPPHGRIYRISFQ